LPTLTRFDTTPTAGHVDPRVYTYPPPPSVQTRTREVWQVNDKGGGLTDLLLLYPCLCIVPIKFIIHILEKATEREKKRTRENQRLIFE
jgi:hypothetical protein